MKNIITVMAIIMVTMIAVLVSTPVQNWVSDLRMSEYDTWAKTQVPTVGASDLDSSVCLIKLTSGSRELSVCSQQQRKDIHASVQTGHYLQAKGLVTITDRVNISTTSGVLVSSSTGEVESADYYIKNIGRVLESGQNVEVTLSGTVNHNGVVAAVINMKAVGLNKGESVPGSHPTGYQLDVLDTLIISHAKQLRDIWSASKLETTEPVASRFASKLTAVLLRYNHLAADKQEVVDVLNNMPEEYKQAFKEKTKGTLTFNQWMTIVTGGTALFHSDTEAGLTIARRITSMFPISMVDPEDLASYSNYTNSKVFKEAIMSGLDESVVSQPSVEVEEIVSTPVVEVEATHSAPVMDAETAITFAAVAKDGSLGIPSRMEEDGTVVYAPQIESIPLSAVKLATETDILAAQLAGVFHIHPDEREDRIVYLITDSNVVTPDSNIQWKLQEFYIHLDDIKDIDMTNYNCEDDDSCS